MTDEQTDRQKIEAMGYTVEVHHSPDFGVYRVRVQCENSEGCTGAGETEDAAMANALKAAEIHHRMIG